MRRSKIMFPPRAEYSFRRLERAPRPLERRELLRNRNLEAERHGRWKRSQQSAKIERAFSWEEAVGAGLADDLVHLCGHARPGVAELRVANALRRHSREHGRRIA